MGQGGADHPGMGNHQGVLPPVTLEDVADGQQRTGVPWNPRQVFPVAVAGAFEPQTPGLVGRTAPGVPPMVLELAFGMPRPEGYRKAMRLMKMAERFKLPVVTFIDTPGAYPGVGAEERGQSEAIARNLFEMAGLRTPIIATVIGEGGSGGALAIGVADHLMMLQYSTYSVISPEGCASILWKDAAKAEIAAGARGSAASPPRRAGCRPIFATGTRRSSIRWMRTRKTGSSISSSRSA